jgi:N-acetylglucosaminyldiphosphoundecaprenol N-acetyl-beta-D-mannosaminyltransferase
MHLNKTVNLLGINLPILDYETALAIFQDWIATKEAHQVCIANVHTMVSCLRDAELKTITQNALTTMDGLPLVWYANLVHKVGIKTRVSGPDLMLKCLDNGRDAAWKHFFLGGTPQALNDLHTLMQSLYPGVQIVGIESPPFRSLSTEEDQRLVTLINDANPDFLWVGLGAPKQEKWIASHLDRIHAPVQIGVGAAFDFHSGHKKRAPNWMQKSGLEWLYRIIKDRRLIKRYLSTNPIFLFLLIRDLLFIRLLKKKPA